MISRRKLLACTGGLSLGAVGASLLGVRNVQASDFKAVVVVFLSGGHDGNNVLIPTDGAYGDYAKSRPSLQLPKDSLIALPGKHIDHSFALSPAMRPLAKMFEQGRMAVVANVGALVQPTTLDQLRNGRAKLPPFLGSHTEQEQWIQGWMGDEDLSGWGGRMLDTLPTTMRSQQPLIALARDYTAVLGRSTPLSLASSNDGARWGRVSLDQIDSASSRIEWASRLQSSNAFEAEFARSMRTAYLDSVEFGKGQKYGAEPAGMFGDNQMGRDMRFVARHLAYSRQAGARRQVYLVQDGGYDTHTGQLSTDPGNLGLEGRLQQVTSSIEAFDASLKAYGLDGQVVTVVMSEFGRTLDPAAGVGSDHAWGNHWFVVGSPVKGGVVYGQQFPTLLTGGPDDASLYDPKRGQWLPQFSSDQFVGDLGRWMGLTEAQLLQGMPNLVNFPKKTIGFL